MKILHQPLVLFMIGHLVSLLHGHAESTLSEEEYLENYPLLSNTSQCRGQLSEDDELVLKRLIFKEKKQLIYLQLNSTLFNATQANVSEILFPSKWVWVTNDAGRPLLELDFRYDVYSFTTLSLDVGEMMVDIEMHNKEERMEYNDLLNLVICSIHDATKRELTPLYSVCHSILAKDDETSGRFYLQYRCCGMHSQKFNSQENQLSNHTCQVLEGDRDGWWTFVIYLLFLVSPLLIRLLHVREDTYAFEQNNIAVDDSEEGCLIPANHEARTNRAKLYVNFDSSTPLRIIHPILYILQFRLQNACICRIRRCGFFAFVYPCIIYMMIAVDIAKYQQLIKNLSDVEKELDVEILGIKLFDRVWLVRPNIYVILSLLSYILVSIILSITSILEDGLSLLENNNGRLGYIDLPHHLCRQHESKHGFLLLYAQMIDRFSLFGEPKFWKFWIKEATRTSTEPCSEQSLPNGESLSRFARLKNLIFCVLSLLWIFPIFNLIILHTRPRTCHPSLPATHENDDCKIYRTAMLFSQCVLITQAYIFTWSCATLAKFILYTIKGIVKHFTKTLPLVSIVVVTVYYIVGTIHRLKEKYKNMKKVTFDECIYLQKDIDDGKIPRNANFCLVVYKPDGIPMIPKDIYEQIIDKHLPLRESEFFAFIKLLLIVISLHYVGITVDAFKMTNALTLGQTIATFFAFTLPKLLEFFYEQDQIEAGRLKFQIRETIKNCLRDDMTDAPNIDAATTVGRECEFLRYMETSV